MVIVLRMSKRSNTSLRILVIVGNESLYQVRLLSLTKNRSLGISRKRLAKFLHLHATKAHSHARKRYDRVATGPWRVSDFNLFIRENRVGGVFHSAPCASHLCVGHSGSHSSKHAHHQTPTDRYHNAISTRKRITSVSSGHNSTIRAFQMPSRHSSEVRTEAGVACRNTTEFRKCRRTGPEFYRLGQRRLDSDKSPESESWFLNSSISDPKPANSWAPLLFSILPGSSNCAFVTCSSVDLACAPMPNSRARGDQGMVRVIFNLCSADL